MLCFNLLLTDPVKQRANSRSQLCEPLQVDDGHGIEDLDQGKAQGNENWDTLDYESLLSVSGSQRTCRKGSRRNLGVRSLLAKALD